MPPLPDDRGLIAREHAFKEARAASISTAKAPLDRGPHELDRPQLDSWHDPQILDWDRMSPSTLSHIHLL